MKILNIIYDYWNRTNTSVVPNIISIQAVCSNYTTIILYSACKSPIIYIYILYAYNIAVCNIFFVVRAHCFVACPTAPPPDHSPIVCTQ